MNFRLVYGIAVPILTLALVGFLTTSADAQTFIATHNLDKTASLIGLLVSVLGFLFTIDQVIAAKTAAEQARTAAEDMRDKIASYDSVAACEKGLAMIEEIKERHRRHEWSIALDRYSILKRTLIEIRHLNPDLPRDSKTKIVSNQTQLTAMQEVVELHLAHPDEEPDAAQLNTILTTEKDKLTQVLSSIRRTSER